MAKLKSRRVDNPTSSTNEFQKYLELTEEDPDDAEFILLDWWKSYQSKFPILSVMARDHLCIQASETAVERAFSESGRRIGKTRSCLAPSTLEATMCNADWIKADLKSQHIRDDGSDDDLDDALDAMTLGDRSQLEDSPED
ncbi:hAT family dimerization domain-containing protein [Bartonella sp. AC134YNZD]|uniref:hAT family dimerization domain-containing protein n=1 Tax=Bartonella sp. AC134YNZD TaxID=3243446 RepID=UPI0035CFB34E